MNSKFEVMEAIMNTTKQCKCHRLAVSINQTLKSDNFESKYRKAIQCITKEEYERVTKFRFKDDALSTLIGRLFLRQASRRLTDAEWCNIEIGRTEKGKPYISKPEDVHFGINVAHQGDYVAFASSCCPKVGVDSMRLDGAHGGKSADEYINSMAKSASDAELRMMRSQPTEQTKMAYFYRFWCLKEAMLKATGEGLLNDMKRLDFRVNQSEKYKPQCFITSTTVLFDQKRQNQWIFEESFIDDRHSVAVCREKSAPSTCIFNSVLETRLFFSKVDLDFLLEKATVINAALTDTVTEWENFDAKPRKTF